MRIPNTHTTCPIETAAFIIYSNENIWQIKKILILFKEMECEYKYILYIYDNRVLYWNATRRTISAANWYVRWERQKERERDRGEQRSWKCTQSLMPRSQKELWFLITLKVYCCGTAAAAAVDTCNCINSIHWPSMRHSPCVWADFLIVFISSVPMNSGQVSNTHTDQCDNASFSATLIN